MDQSTRTRAPEQRAARRNYLIMCVMAAVSMAALYAVTALLLFPE